MNDFKHINQRGNALFLILIAVALFAALGFNVSEMMRGGNASIIGEEQSKIFAGEILDYGRNVRQVVQSLRIDGCRDTEISFENNIISGYTNGVNTDCQVFNADGGGLSFINVPDDFLDNSLSGQTGYGEYFYSGNVRVRDVGSGTGGNEDLELAMFLPYLKESICRQLNDLIDMNTSAGEIPSENFDAWHSSFSKFVGVFGDSTTRQLDGDDPVGLSGCREGNGTPPSGSYYFYQVLISR